MADFPSNRPQGGGYVSQGNKPSSSSNHMGTNGSGREPNGYPSQHRPHQGHSRPSQASPYKNDMMSMSRPHNTMSSSSIPRSHTTSSSGGYGMSIGSNMSGMKSSANVMNTSIPAKSKPMKAHLIQQVSERPFVIKIRKYSTIPKSKPLPINLSSFNSTHNDSNYSNKQQNANETTTRSGRRVQNLKRPTYDFDSGDSDELEFDDSSVLMHSADTASGILPKKRSRPNAKSGTGSIKNSSQSGVGSHLPSSLSQASLNSSLAENSVSTTTSFPLTLSNMTPSIEGPPPSVLPSLWYSRECCLHIYVIEKILSWKKRHKVVPIHPQSSSTTTSSINTSLPQSLTESSNEANATTPLSSSITQPTGVPLDGAEYEKISNQVLDHLSSIRKPRRRMEVSRINPSQCPIVLTTSTAIEKSITTRSAISSAPFSDSKLQLKQQKPQYRVSEETEDVLLIKWRGHSYMHCSWERPSDLIRLDPTNNTAKHKIKRYYALQESILGLNWKHVLEEGRRTSSTPPPPNPDGTNAASTSLQQVKKNEDDDDEELEEMTFPPEYTEAERILACDENEMDMKIFQKQLKINQEMETKLLDEREKESINPTAIGHHLGGGAKAIVLDPEQPWDPEDNVRYVVKWKGMQNSDVTWEYWKDLKYDFVQEVADFWERQRAPTMEVVKKALVKTHPLVKDFKKLQESPLFGKKTSILKQLDAEDDDEEQSTLRLRGYQLEGVNWLLWNWFNKRSCILADEMGLGKTIQSIGLLDQLSKLDATKIRGPFLIVAPLSLISQWQSESKAWAPDLNVVVYHGSADARDFMVKHEFYYNEQFVGKGMHTKLRKMNWTKFHVLITTFEVVLKDNAVLSKIRWRCLIVDEAHRLKNAKSRLFLELATVPRDFCLLLTGTPLQNSTEELWALLCFADPIGFASKEAFIEKFGQLTDSKQVRDLHGILKPYLLRRVKEDVEKALPPKEETILEVTLTPIQKTYYKAIYEKNTSFLFKGSKPSNAPSLMNIMMELRKCCNHPFLIRGAEERIIADAAAAVAAKATENKKEGEEQAAPINMLQIMGENLVTSSGKMVLLSKLLPKLKDGGHKVLIFSQMVKVLDLLEELLRNKRYRYERLDGSTSASSRSAAVDRFCRKSYQRFVMLLSTRAGGLGLNLTAADTVIIFDSDWNPQNDLQAMARAHRIGQTRAVRVYRLLTAKTYEMHMFHSASMKLGLDRAVLAHQRHNDAQASENGEASTKSKIKKEKEIQAKEIDQLLKKGAYDVFRDEDDDKESKQFMDTDIDSLLERSSRKVTYGKTAETAISSGLGSFSKASFVASAGDDIDLDDPDFWKKAVGFEAPPDGVGEPGYLGEGVEGKKRNRKQVQVFDPYAAFAEAEQRKQDKIIAKAKEEKEEKERLRKAKKLKKQQEKDKRKREREEAKEAKDRLLALSVDQKKQRIEDDRLNTKDRKCFKEGKHKKMKKNERTKRLRQILYEDPLLERLKQAWESSQRNRAINAALGFGLGRLCKVRQESFLTSLPIQDLEVFLRGYLYQVGLQAGVSFLDRLRCAKDKNVSEAKNTSLNMLQELIRTYGETDGRWMSLAMFSAINLHDDIRNRKCSLRIPLSLTYTSFVDELKEGAAIHALHRFAFLARLTKLIDNALDRILAELGHEELGKRGCSTKDLSTFDVDMKARHVTTEELAHSIGMDFDVRHINTSSSPCFHSLAPWWDRSCDIALIIGTFIHGLGNYKSMQKDEDLPYGFKISQYAVVDMFSFQAFQNFNAATKAAHKLYNECLIQPNRSDDEASLVSKQVESVQKNDGQKKSSSTVKMNEESFPYDKKIDNDANDANGTLNLTNISKTMIESIQATAQSFKNGLEKSKKTQMLKLKKHVAKSSKASGNKNSKTEGQGNQNEFLPWNQRLPMPDSLKLDQHLVWLIDNIEKNIYLEEDKSTKLSIKKTSEKSSTSTSDQSSTAISISNDLLKSCMKELHGEVTFDSNSHLNFSNNKYGSKYKSSCDDSANKCETWISDVGDVFGGDPSCFKRFIGIPIVLTKYCLSGLVFADEAVTQTLSSELQAMDATKKEEQPSGNLSERKSGAKLAFSSDSDFVCFRKITPTYLQLNSQDRAKVCISILQNGSPFFKEEKSFNKIHISAWSALYGDDDMDDDSMSDRDFFNTQSFLQASKLTNQSGDVIHLEMIESYINYALLPHCLSLCLQGTGSTDGENRQLNAINTGLEGKTLLPDPCITLFQHSEDAVKIASAILRRTRLMKAIRYILGGGVPGALLSSFLRSHSMRKNLVGLPIWWCPWIHDLALLMYAATYGLFAVIIDKSQNRERFMNHRVFGTDAVETHIRTIFLDGLDGLKPALPQSILNGAPSKEKEAWLQMHAKQFPEVNVIERRLAFICSELTATAAGMNARNKMAEWRFENFPMFDHGGLGCMFNGGDNNRTTSVSKCLLRTVEDEANDESSNTLA